MEGKQQTAGRYETRCVRCGTVLKEIDRPQAQTCKCGEITAHSGRVFEREHPKPKKGEQSSMFANQTDYID